MDLHSAVKRYDEARRFWAREIALLLVQRGARSQLAALGKLAAKGEPLRGDCLLDARYADAHSRETSSSQLCLSLLRGGLVTRHRHSLGEHSRPFFYALTELGALVLEYIPDDYEVGGLKKRGRPRKTPGLEAQSV